MRRLGLLLALLQLACENPTPPSDAAPVGHGESQEAGASALARRGAELAFRWRQVHGRLVEPMPQPEAFHEGSCPDERIQREATTSAARTLSLDFDDARFGARSLMPLTMTRSLRSSLEKKLEALLAPPSTSQSLRFEFSSDARANRAERLLTELDQQAYKGVFFVVQYKKPHLVRKKGKLKREWLPGMLQSWFVVYHIDTSEALCARRLTVVSDVEDEPVWLRSKATTRDKLIVELGQTMLDEGRRALASMSSLLTLELPDAGSVTPQRTVAALGKVDRR